jgi:hypothetical protein
VKTDWVQRRTFKVGTCANAPVWWNERGGTVHILGPHLSCRQHNDVFRG